VLILTLNSIRFPSDMRYRGDDSVEAVLEYNSAPETNGTRESVFQKSVIKMCHTNPMQKAAGSFGVLAVGVIAAYLLLLGCLTFALHRSGQTLSQFALLAEPGQVPSLSSHLDEWEYATLGHSLLHGTFTLDGKNPDFFRTPGYPLLLTAIYSVADSPIAVIFVQILLVALSAVLIAKIGETVFSKKVGFIAAILYALDPTTIISSFNILSDTLFMFVLLLCVYFVLQKTSRLYVNAMLLGALAGYLMLVRPIAEFVLPLLALWFACEVWQRCAEVGKERLWFALRNALLVLVAAGVVVAPWLWRNYQERHVVALSSISSFNFLLFNLAIFNAYQHNDSQDVENAKLRQDVGAPNEAAIRDFAYTPRINEVIGEQLHGRGLSYAFFHIEKLAPFYFDSSLQTALQTLHQHGVLQGAGAPPVSASLLLMHGHVFDALKIFLSNPYTLLERVFWVLVILLCIVALILARPLAWRGGRLHTTLLFFAAAALLFGILTGPLAFPRYRLPAEPFLLLGATVGATLVIKKPR
jgi:4-amino-4-deoxy-L-arabinose transferase-like glycosyltransferase